MNKFVVFVCTIPISLIGLGINNCANARGYCNEWGCSSCGVCSAWGCPRCSSNSFDDGGMGLPGLPGLPGLGGSSGGNTRGRGSGPTQTCNAWGCGVDPNPWGSSPNGTCNAWGCP